MRNESCASAPEVVMLRSEQQSFQAAHERVVRPGALASTMHRVGHGKDSNQCPPDR